MASRILLWAVLAASLSTSGCRKPETGPVEVSAIGAMARIANPNRDPLDPPSAFLLQSTAEGLVRFDADGDIEPGLAQSWLISDDGLRYTFRLARLQWRDRTRITAQQVVARLRMAAAPSSRNALKPVLGAIDAITPMTDEVLEISLKSPRPNFLQLLAQPEMALVRNGQGAGPLSVAKAEAGVLTLIAPPSEEDEDRPREPPVRLRGEKAGLAIARFEEGEADLVLGGTLGDLPLARAADVPNGTLVFDPVAGLLGLAFTGSEGPLAKAEARQALSMAIDRSALVAALAVPALRPRVSLLPPGIEGIGAPAVPLWTASPLPARRALAARTLAGMLKGERLHIRVAMPQGFGFGPLFAQLRRDWAAIGVEAERVGPNGPADLQLVDEVAPVGLASWYLRHFSCEASQVCDPAADAAMEAARGAPNQDVRRGFLMDADRILAGSAPFISIAAPVRWSLVARRLTGFRPNPFGRHPAGELIRPAP